MTESNRSSERMRRWETAGWAMAGPALAVAGAATWGEWSRETVLHTLVLAGAAGWIVALGAWGIGRIRSG